MNLRALRLGPGSIRSGAERANPECSLRRSQSRDIKARKRWFGAKVIPVAGNARMIAASRSAARAETLARRSKARREHGTGWRDGSAAAGPGGWTAGSIDRAAEPAPGSRPKQAGAELPGIVANFACASVAHFATAQTRRHPATGQHVAGRPCRSVTPNRFPAATPPCAWFEFSITPSGNAAGMDVSAPRMRTGC